MKRTRLAIKDYYKETALFRNRCLAALIIVLLFTIVLVARLAFLQIKDHRFYSTLSRHNLLNLIPIEPNRGLIYDRNGVLLAKNIPSFTLAIIPDSVPNLQKTIAKLNEIIPITPNEIKQFHHILYQYRHFQPVPIKLKLTDSEVAKFYVNRYRFPGVVIQTRLLRYYPLGDVTSDVIGYVDRINQHDLQRVNSDNYNADDDIGKTGIEKYYEKQLHGMMGAEEAEINASGRVVRILKRIPPKPGDTIYLTIDSKLQAEAEKVMGDESGAIVIIQPNTGQILALVTKPTYDPNPFVSGLNQDDYLKLLNSPQHPLYNRATQGQFAPGSTIKPFFALAGLDDDVTTPQYKIYDPGWFQLPNTAHIYHDWWRSGHGWVDLRKAIIVSCDTYFYNLAVGMGISRMVDMLHKFGFGNPTGIDMPGELGGLVPTPKWKMGAHGHPWYTGDTIITGIGQGFLLITPIQLAQAVSTLAEHGNRFKPDLVLKTVSPTGKVTPQEPIPEPPVLLKHPKYWDFVIHAMEGVVAPGGTADFFGRHHGFTVAAKTGTAQVYGHQRDEDTTRTDIPKRLRNNHLFIAFAPVENPQIAVAIVVEHSAMADRMAGKIFNYYFQHPIKQPTNDNNNELPTPST
ncbi:penicillin-binding protein 2 [Candidiatus Paracoxiella cheracis]|uniref:penicillin-binding protein 2 n=1 Tax=Candidiatus Paracoxiella cheracis TaxID=3405120 RepID=UPI003BF5E904